MYIIKLHRLVCRFITALCLKNELQYKVWKYLKKNISNHLFRISISKILYTNINVEFFSPQRQYYFNQRTTNAILNICNLLSQKKKKNTVVSTIFIQRECHPNSQKNTWFYFSSSFVKFLNMNLSNSFAAVCRHLHFIILFQFFYVPKVGKYEPLLTFNIIFIFNKAFLRNSVSVYRIQLLTSLSWKNIISLINRIFKILAPS